MLLHVCVLISNAVF